MRCISVTIVLCLAGCAPYTRVQMELVEQARRGVEIWKQREAQRDAEVRQRFAAQRDELARAFDEDARQLPPQELSAQWIIEARQAYATGLDLLFRAEHAALAANENARQNADAVDAALQKLLWLQSIELELGSFNQTSINQGEQP